MSAAASRAVRPPRLSACSTGPRPRARSPPSLHDALPIWAALVRITSNAALAASHGSNPCLRASGAYFSTVKIMRSAAAGSCSHAPRSEEHTSELQSRGHLVCRLLLGHKEGLPAVPHERCGVARRPSAPALSLFHWSSPTRPLASFPTRRSSDLGCLGAHHVERRAGRLPRVQPVLARQRCVLLHGEDHEVRSGGVVLPRA